MDASTPPPKQRLAQVREAIRLKYYAYRTEQTYAQWIRRYILFHNKPDILLDLEDKDSPSARTRRTSDG